MPATLSPFRYIQLARYVIQWWVDASPAFAARRKAAQERAAQFIHAPRLRTRAFAASPVANAQVGEDPLLLKTSAAQRNVEVDALPSKSIPRNPDVDVSGLEPRPDRHPDPRYPPENTEIYRLMNDPRAFLPSKMKAPKEIIVLCHGLYGFSTATPIPLFPSLKLHYWASVLEVLRDRIGAQVVVVGVKGTGSIQERAEQMHAFLKDYLPKGAGVNFVAHSMGGLDARHLISTIKPKEYTPLSLTSIATPHRGSPFMDWCAANIGVGSHPVQDLAKKAAEAAKYLPFTLKSPLLTRDLTDAPAPKESDALSTFSSAFTNYLLNIFDTPAYNNLTTAYLRDQFNPNTPDDPNVKYYSVAGRVPKVSILHPLWFTKLVLDSAAEKGYPAEDTLPGHSYEGNDGLVSVASAKWGEFLGVVDGCHHWDLRGEGGLWPQGIVNGDKKPPMPKPDNNEEVHMNGGWDWEHGVGLDNIPGKDTQLDPAQHAKDLAAARAMSPEKKDSSASPFDLATVGQIIDWVGDLFPGDKKQEEPTHQLADARSEMEANKSSKKVVREKFDLARFYGGLMLRLREEGL